MWLTPLFSQSNWLNPSEVRIGKTDSSQLYFRPEMNFMTVHPDCLQSIMSVCLSSMLYVIGVRS